MKRSRPSWSFLILFAKQALGTGRGGEGNGDAAVVGRRGQKKKVLKLILYMILKWSIWSRYIIFTAILLGKVSALISGKPALFRCLEASSFIRSCSASMVASESDPGSPWPSSFSPPVLKPVWKRPYCFKSWWCLQLFLGKSSSSLRATSWWTLARAGALGLWPMTPLHLDVASFGPLPPARSPQALVGREHL